MAVSWRRDFYGKLGANDLTIAAGETCRLIIDHGQEISFSIEFAAHFEGVSGTEFNTIAAALAPFLVYVYLAWSCSCLGVIERFSPQFHNYTIYD
jgi:hypothetical protein